MEQSPSGEAEWVKTAAFVVWQELTHVPEALTAFTVRAIP
jgi:hypothetical protein